MKYTTHTIIGTVSALMVVGMITSFVAASETYFFGQKSASTSVSVRPRQRAITNYAQASVLMSDVSNTSRSTTPSPVNPTPVKKNRSSVPVRPDVAPRSCSEQNMYTYTGSDNGSLLYGMCIPCPMNTFNVQQKTCVR